LGHPAVQAAIKAVQIGGSTALRYEISSHPRSSPLDGAIWH